VCYRCSLSACQLFGCRPRCIAASWNVAALHRIAADASGVPRASRHVRPDVGSTAFRELCRPGRLADSVAAEDRAGRRPRRRRFGRLPGVRRSHVRRGADGRLVLIDVFCMDGASLYRKILEDVAGVHRRIPRERMRYALDIRYIAPGEQYRRDPCPQKGLGARCRMTARGSASEQPPMPQATPEQRICRLQ
jgi:hypothetical protein